MLELALLIPLYMLVFFAVWTAGDIGLVSQTAHLGARYAAWTREPVTANAAMNAVAGGTLRAAPVTGAFSSRGYAHRPGKDGFVAESSMLHWTQIRREEAFSFKNYLFAPPLAWTGRATVNSFKPDSKESDADTALSGHSGHYLTPSDVISAFPANHGDAEGFKYSASMLATAMEGDFSYGEKMPWLERKTARAAFSMRGAAGITSRNSFASTHTVTLGKKYFTMVPDYYVKIGEGKPLSTIDGKFISLYYGKVSPIGHSPAQRVMLRNPRALRHELTNKSKVDGEKLHQLHYVKAREDLVPPF